MALENANSVYSIGREIRILIFNLKNLFSFIKKEKKKISLK